MTTIKTESRNPSQTSASQRGGCVLRAGEGQEASGGREPRLVSGVPNKGDKTINGPGFPLNATLSRAPTKLHLEHLLFMAALRHPGLSSLAFYLRLPSLSLPPSLFSGPCCGSQAHRCSSIFSSIFSFPHASHRNTLRRK